MSMTIHVMNFLARDPSVQRVHFRYNDGSNTHLVHTGDYRTIAERIRGNTLKVTWDPSTRGPASASYLALEDKMVIQSPHANLEHIVVKSSVVHEATHAIFDMQCSVIECSDEEAVAYVAQLLWVKVFQSSTGSGGGSIPGRGPSTETAKITDAALAVVDRHDLTRRRPTLRRRDLNELRAAIEKHSEYEGNVGNTYHRNGIPRPEVVALRRRNRIHMNQATRLRHR